MAANSSNLASASLAGMSLLKALTGMHWQYHDGKSGPPAVGRHVAEVYPYTTIVGVEELGYDVERPLYKRKPRHLPAAAFRPVRAAACDELVARVASLVGVDPPLDLLSHPVTARLVDEPSPLPDLPYKHREDLLDARDMRLDRPTLAAVRLCPMSGARGGRPERTHPDDHRSLPASDGSSGHTDSHETDAVRNASAMRLVAFRRWPARTTRVPVAAYDIRPQPSIKQSAQSALCPPGFGYHWSPSPTSFSAADRKNTCGRHWSICAMSATFWLAPPCGSTGPAPRTLRSLSRCSTTFVPRDSTTTTATSKPYSMRSRTTSGDSWRR